MKINRRKAIKLSLFGGGCLLLPAVLKKQAAHANRREIEKFKLPFQTPPVLQPVRRDATTDYYEIIVKKAKQEIFPGFQTEIWGYNGITPGSTIHQQANRRSQVRLINKLGEDTYGQKINADESVCDRAGRIRSCYSCSCQTNLRNRK
jgi:spore coat protein A, manganese oxidase